MSVCMFKHFPLQQLILTHSFVNSSFVFLSGMPLAQVYFVVWSPFMLLAQVYFVVWLKMLWLKHLPTCKLLAGFDLLQLAQMKFWIPPFVRYYSPNVACTCPKMARTKPRDGAWPAWGGLLGGVGALFIWVNVLDSHFPG